MMKVKTTIEHGGNEYEATLARVKGTHLGYESHGILSLNIDFEGASESWSQGTGHYFVTNPVQLFGLVKPLVDFFGQWESIPGRECFILRDYPSGPILGLASKDDDKILIFSEVIAAQKNGDLGGL